MKTTPAPTSLSGRIAAHATADRAMDAWIARITTPGR